MSATKTADEIRGEMALLRSQLRSSAEAFGDNARVLGDWRYYVQRFPWPCLSAAVLAGFVLVPRRLEVITRGGEALINLADEDRVRIESKPQPQETGPSGQVVPLLVNTILRAGFALAGQRAGQMFGRRSTSEESRE